MAVNYGITMVNLKYNVGAQWKMVTADVVRGKVIFRLYLCTVCKNTVRVEEYLPDGSLLGGAAKRISHSDWAKDSRPYQHTTKEALEVLQARLRARQECLATDLRDITDDLQQVQIALDAEV